MLPELIPAPAIDHSRMHQYRLQRIRQLLHRDEIAFCILVNPVSLRYAVDFREYGLFQSHIPMFYLFVPAAGPVVMHGASHQTCDLVDEYRPSLGFNPFDSGLNISPVARQLAIDIKSYLAELGWHDARPRVAVETMPSDVFHALTAEGVELTNGDTLMEEAKTIKSREEIQCIRHAINVAQHGMDRMRAVMAPGITENQLWSVLTQYNTANNGDWHDGRMLASGHRTNPWLREASDKVIQQGELVAFDTDMIGPFGYCADISRTWRCGNGKPSRQQQSAYRHAFEEVSYNIAQVTPGISFGELVGRIYRRADEYIPHRYPCVFHGVGMTDEYPKLYYPEDGHRQYDGVIETDMVLCVESFSGSIDGGEGVKLEQMIRVTENGCELLSDYPFEEELL